MMESGQQKTNKMRCVVDTNTLVKIALRRSDYSLKALNMVLRDAVLLQSPSSFAELCYVLIRPKFEKYIDAEGIEEFTDLIFKKSDMMITTSRTGYSPDPKDNMFIDLALDGGAKLIVTTDRRHLIGLDEKHPELPKIIDMRELVRNPLAPFNIHGFIRDEVRV